eukprot:CAMPEP_0198152674 /NCGR_PEP_ID=MMETSP1443-20131203/60790_1 /TAXON_ID=186043 /ORGANISM="Entomoneis sp., Strain CCMP2396" /LENGTH=316 /DNA_ID=CAMNT_0043818775 /DNA_START=185 /DNA_END=1135 /DNA_ORIENTATION=-
MAQQSKYIDVMLASPMKESQTNEISFPDIDLDTWDMMMKYLNASEARRMTVEDVLVVGEYYDQYDFVQGRLLCDQVLLEYFQGSKQQENEMSLDVDTMVEAITLAFKANLTDAFKEGSGYVKEKLTVHKIPFGPTMFDREQIAKLVPLIIHFCEDDSSFRHGLHPWDEYGKEEIESSLFPRLFVSEWQLVETDRVLKQDFLSHIVLSGTCLEADGSFKSENPWVYECDRFTEIDGEWFGFSIQFSSDCWTIVAKSEEQEDGNAAEEKILWENPYSGNLPLPPRMNWKAVHSVAKGRQPTIQYIRQRVRGLLSGTKP